MPGRLPAVLVLCLTTAVVPATGGESEEGALAFARLRADLDSGAGAAAALAHVVGVAAGTRWEARARVLAAERLYGAGDPAAAAELLQAPCLAGTGYLEAYASYLLALLHVDTDRDVAYRGFATAFERAGETLLRHRAGLWLAEELRERGDAAAALGLVETLRSPHLPESTLADIEVRRALLLEELGRGDEAAAVLSDLYLSQPLLGLRAETAPLDRIVRGRLEDRLDALPAARLLDRAEALLEAKAPSDAEADARRVLRRDGAERDRARFVLARALLERGQAAKALAEVERLPDTPELRADVLGLRARCLRALGRDRAYQTILTLLANGGAPGPAGTRAALELARQIEDRDPQGAQLLWQRIAREDGGTAAAEALWKVGWMHYAGGAYAEAAAALADLSARSPAPAEGARAAFWAARALERLDRFDESLPFYLHAARAQPHGYYGLAAARRIRPLVPDLAGRDGELALPPPPDPLAVAPPHVAAAIEAGRELMSIGLADDAVAELELQVRRLAPEPAPRALLAHAYHAIGNHLESVRWLKRAFPDHERSGLPRDYLTYFYPLRYWETIERGAQENGIDPYFVAAVIYQESRFNSTARSSAGAEGLMQIMPRTGREIARTLGEPAARTPLFDPDRNIRFGLHYLRRLLEAHGGDPVLALCGYNAGPGRSRRWGQGGIADHEEFIENIPFLETRTYVKNILVAHAGYHLAYGPDVPCPFGF